MKGTSPLLLFAVAPLLLGGCVWLKRPAKTGPAAAPTEQREPLAPSPRLILGRVIAVDAERGFAFLELAPDAAPAALAEGSELITRTEDLRETSRLRASRYLRGRTLGATITRGQPAAGNEVVWLAP